MAFDLNIDHRGSFDPAFDRHKLEIAVDITAAVATAGTEQQAVDAAIDMLARETGAEYVEAWGRHPDTGTILFHEFCDPENKSLDLYRKQTRAAAGTGMPPLCETVWNSSTPRWIRLDPGETDPAFLRASMAIDAGFGSIFSLPIKTSSNDTLFVCIFYFLQHDHQDDMLCGFLTDITARLGEVLQRKRVEEKLLKREEQLSLISKHMDQAIWLTDRWYEEVLYVSPAVEEIWGVAPKCFYENTTLEYLRPVIEEDKAYVHETCKKIPDAPQMFEFRIRKPDGSVRWIQETTTPVKDSNGETSQIVGVSRDITDQKTSRLALAESEEQLRLIVDNTQDTFWLVDSMVERLLYISPNVEWLHGYTPEELISNPDLFFYGVVSKKDHELMKRRYAQLAEQECEYQYEIVAGDGHLITARDRTIPVRDENGQVKMIVGVTSDITREAIARDELTQTINRFNVAAEAAKIGVWEYVVDSQSLIWDERMHDIYGRTQAEFGGKYEDWAISLHPEDREPAEALLQHSMRNKCPFNAEFRIVLKDGEVRHIKANATFFYDEKTGEPIQAIGANIDVTEQRRIECQLKQIQTEEAIGKLSGGIAHDFNNLLTVMKGNLQLIAQQPGIQSDEKIKRWIDAALGASERGTSLTQRLLAHSRQQVLEPSIFNVGDVLRQMHELASRTIGDNIDVALTVADDLATIRTDVGQFENAVLNLVVNSRDAMPNGGNLIIEASNTTLSEEYAKRHTDVRPGPYVLIEITDSGCGIPADVLKHVFEPYFTTKAVGAGTGLGLSMVMGFVKQAQGHASIYSEAGCGTTARLYFPAYTGQVNPLDNQSDDVPISPMNPIKILLVDDDVSVRNTAESIFRETGFTVLACSSSQEAVSLLTGHDDIDLLFTDLVMPGGMNGLELAEKCRQMKPEIKVIFTSGYAEGALRRMGVANQPGVWIAKPYDTNNLLSVIFRVLQPSGAAESTPV